MIPQPTQSGEVRREIGLAPSQSAGERWRHAFGLARDYWTSSDWKFAWAALLVLVAFQFGVVYIFVAANRWEQAFFDSVEAREVDRFAALVLVFFGIMAMQIVAVVGENAVRMALAFRWRMFLTHRYLDRWMARNRFAEIERLRMIDNPDQRVAEDIAKFTGTAAGSLSALSITLGVIGATVGAITFGAILMETAQPIRFNALGQAIAIPGSTVWYALIYALVGSIVIGKVGGPFIRANMRQQHCEADFRANLIHVRRNAQQIGFVGATQVEAQGLRASFDHVRRNYRTIILTTLGINVGQSIYDRIGAILPLFVLLPSYFAGSISFGQVMGARDAFQRMVQNLSYFVQVFPAIGAQVANANRLKGLDDAIDAERASGIVVTADAPPGTAFATRDLAVVRPHGEPLLTVDDWSVHAGERWVVQGASGTGKSTLLRAMVGLWPDGTGAVSMTGEGVTMLVPQRLYLPLGTLKAAICFPDPPEAHDDADIADVLARVRLSAHREELHAVRVWQEELSPGEQQRIALARILLHRPTLLVVDEATSALDADNAQYFYEQVLAALPSVTMISVVHDDRLRRYHSHALTIADGTATASPIGDAA